MPGITKEPARATQYPLTASTILVREVWGPLTFYLLDASAKIGVKTNRNRLWIFDGALHADVTLCDSTRYLITSGFNV